MKRILLFLIIILFIISMSGCQKNSTYGNGINIVTTNFPCYDFARAITLGNEQVNISMLLKPGADVHDYEPTPKDIRNIKQSDMFIYIGGESDIWVESIVNGLDKSHTKIIRLMDYVDILYEEYVEGMESEDSIGVDEHIWTSPVNVINIINKLEIDFANIDPDNAKLYENNSQKYKETLIDIDQEIKDIVANSKRKELIFGDRFPFRYFTNEYSINYYAAFSGCSDATEASAKTISFLINKVKKNKIPVILKIELSNGKIANSIAKETNTKVLTLHSAHNISSEDFKNGITYIDIMNKNIEVLKEALN